eukprot:m.461410 g.461410  ORF g.461410 m.461410 type:complete len:212 (+) comp22298_c0_seq1:201-836(+)
MSSTVEQILTARGPREVLSLKRGTSLQTVSQSQLRRAYHNLCLEVHPDKCPDPRAQQAFQRLSAAFDELRRLCNCKGAAASSQQSQSAGGPDAPPTNAREKPIGVTAGDWKWRRAAAGPVEPRKWWEQKSFVEIERYLRVEEAELERELTSAVRKRQQQVAMKKVKTKRNAQRISAGLQHLRSKYKLPTSPGLPATAKRDIHTPSPRRNSR